MYVDNFLARVATIDPTINQLEKFGIINVDALLYNLGQDKIYKLTLKSSIRWFILGGGSTNLMAIVPEGRYIISNIVWQYCTTTESFITNLIILIQIRQAEHWLQNVASPNRGEKYRRLHGKNIGMLLPFFWAYVVRKEAVPHMFWQSYGITFHLQKRQRRIQGRGAYYYKNDV